MKKYIQPFILAVLLIGVIVGFFSGYFWNNSDKAIAPIRLSNDNYEFIKPLIAVNRATQGEFSADFEILHRQVKNYIENNVSSNDKISVYYQDLNGGGWFGIDEDRGYYPASLLKVILLIGYLKEAEEYPNLLQKEFIFTPSLAKSIDENPYQSKTKLVAGHAYKIEDLLERVIRDSDNGAKDLLQVHTSDGYLNKIYSDIGLEAPVEDKYTISTRSYSLFFRILYNGTYLNNEMSEKALGILSTVTYDRGLVRGIPKDTKIAHKFGVRIIRTDTDEVTGIEIHDCGIVFKAERPYFICIMTEGTDEGAISDHMKEISGMVYKASPMDPIK